ncbi:GNAT family N-acetyltransferase [Pseudomonas viridiflava]|uniref:GNAT family N-acetyltransferase n=1 Tax=Pseudomonas viridiflava TaxID=33069 RepID=UPI0030DC9A2E
MAVTDQKVVGTLQLTFLPNISHMGAWRAQIEAVRVHEEVRGTGLGRQLFEWAFDQACERGCAPAQFTCDRARPDAHRFYESLGFFPATRASRASVHRKNTCIFVIANYAHKSHRTLGCYELRLPHTVLVLN